MTTLRGMFPFTCTLTLAHLSLQISWIICLQITIRLWINDHNSTQFTRNALVWTIGSLSGEGNVDVSCFEQRVRQ